MQEPELGEGEPIGPEGSAAAAGDEQHSRTVIALHLGVALAALLFGLSNGGLLGFGYFDLYNSYDTSGLMKAMVILQVAAGAGAWLVCQLGLNTVSSREPVTAAWALSAIAAVITTIGLIVEGFISPLALTMLFVLLGIGAHLTAVPLPRRAEPAADDRSDLQRAVDISFIQATAINAAWLLIIIAFLAAFRAIGEYVLLTLLALIMLSAGVGGAIGRITALRMGVERGGRLGAMVLLGIGLLVGTVILIFAAVFGDAAFSVIENLSDPFE